MIAVHKPFELRELVEVRVVAQAASCARVLFSFARKAPSSWSLRRLPAPPRRIRIAFSKIWGFRSAPLCVERHRGLVMGLGDSGIVEVVESVDTAGAPEAQIKAIQDAFARYPD